MGDFQFPNNKPSRLRRQKRRDKRLHEEVIECRRWGGGDDNKKYRTKGRVKRLQKERLGETPSFRASINERDGLRTSFTDNLEPLLRFLQQNVGRRWDDVYSELNQQLDRSTVTGLHVFDHLKQFIEPWPFQKWEEKIEHYSPYKDGTSRKFRIHPATGILCAYNADYKRETGPFPKKARFKKEKEKRKSKLRLGLPLEKPTQPPPYQPQTLLCHILKHELGSDPKHPCWHLLNSASFDLSDGVRRLILKIESIHFGFCKPGYWSVTPLSNVVIVFQMSSLTFGQRHPDVRFYESEWETAGERGAVKRILSFKKLDDRK